MKPDQQLFAKQAIDEIVLLGRLGKLSLNYLQNLSEPSTEYCASVDSPDQTAVQFIPRPSSTNSRQTGQFTPQVAVPFISPALSTDSGQFSPQAGYSCIYELLSDTQFE